ncbi:hypothetical protein [Acinetobacter cumulans]|uniref:hypothetical protein n=1 Tax=Acinetobacter cumulans TaxID=2136182 RepID=UPI0011C3FB7C|nr:hypothetical protein [Acinetobacter cumulans]
MSTASWTVSKGIWSNNKKKTPLRSCKSTLAESNLQFVEVKLTLAYTVKPADSMGYLTPSYKNILFKLNSADKRVN